MDVKLHFPFLFFDKASVLRLITCLLTEQRIIFVSSSASACVWVMEVSQCDGYTIYCTFPADLELMVTEVIMKSDQKKLQTGVSPALLSRFRQNVVSLDSTICVCVPHLCTVSAHVHFAIRVASALRPYSSSVSAGKGFPFCVLVPSNINLSSSHCSLEAIDLVLS